MVIILQLVREDGTSDTDADADTEREKGRVTVLFYVCRSLMC